MNICFLGSYNSEYPRNRILIDGLQKNGSTVYECQSAQGSILKRYPELFKKFWRIKNTVEIIYVAFVGHLDMPLAWLLARLTGKKVVFDMFYSMYDTYVFDRQSAKPGSLRAGIYFLIDKIAAMLADIVITDTKTHGNYFIRTFGLNPQKFRRVFVGGDETVFKPLKNPSTKLRIKKLKKITVEFHGMFTRLHGAEYYVQAAKLLENEKNLKFLLIGSTANYSLPIEMYRRLKPKTMKYYPKMEVAKLARVVASSDISVGHIGITEKAHSVITNKTFHALACGVATIAGDCSANRELLTDRHNTVLVGMGDPKDLAKKIKLLITNKKLRRKIAQEGYQLFQNRLTDNHLGKELLTIFKSV